MTDRRQWSVLIGLALIWLALIAFRVMNEPEPQRVPLVFVSGQAVAREAERRSKTRAPAILLATSAHTTQVTFKAPKNIFAPLDLRSDEEKAAIEQARLLEARKKAEAAAAVAAKTAPPAPPPLTPEESAVQEAQRQAELARQQKEQAIQQARTAMGKYRFIGYLTRNGAPQAFLGKGTEIYIVKAGENLEGKIHVTTIEATTVKLTEGGTNTEASLPLVKEGGGS
jgi:hypothetical protein